VSGIQEIELKELSQIDTSDATEPDIAKSVEVDDQSGKKEKGTDWPLWRKAT